MLLTLVSVNLGSNQYGNITTSMQSFSQLTILLQLGYAFVLAQLLLGDLYTPGCATPSRPSPLPGAAGSAPR